MLHIVSPKQSTAAKQIVFFSLEDWDEVWRRNQFICAGLHDKHPELEILWVCPPIDLLHEARRGAKIDHQNRLNCLNSVPGYSRIKTFKSVKLLPNAVARSLNNWYLQMQVRNAVKQLGWESWINWVNDQKARCYLPSQLRIIYDITDDWAELAQSARHRKLVKEDDEWATDRAEAVIVCSEKLYEKKKGRTARLNLIRNGVDHRRYHPDWLSGVEPASDIDMIKRPIAGYTGTLHDQRLDLALIQEVAQLMPTVNFVFVGPNYLSEDQTKQLTALPNILILGAKPYTDLPRYVAAFDLCITPHKVSSFTESLDPLKLYEYMSTGKPIVSTACAGFRELEPLVKIASTSKTFAEAILQALDSSPGDAASREQRLLWGASCSWTERVKEVERVLGW